MATLSNPATSSLEQSIGPRLLFVQVVIRPNGAGYEIRHVDNEHMTLEMLETVDAPRLRELAQHTDKGVFRPLKSSPDLRAGWRATARTPQELHFLLDQLYPNGVADWFAAQSDSPPITDYRTFTNRQSGMYRSTAMLSDDSAASATTACCHRRFCLKRRLWNVPGLEADAESSKSVLPCLEPCALMLEFARQVFRMEQQQTEVATSEGNSCCDELQSARAALEFARDNPDPQVRQADFSNPVNPRRVEWILRRLPNPSVSRTSGGNK